MLCAGACGGHRPAGARGLARLAKASDHWPVGALDRLQRFQRELGATPALWWAFVYFFCLLSGYYVLRPVRDAMAASPDADAVFPMWLIEAAAGAGVVLGDYTLQVLFSATFVAMLLMQPVYGALVSRFPRRIFLPAVYLFFIACLLGFYLVFHAALPGRGALFFVWLAVFNLFAVSVFWSFMADVFSNVEAKRVYGYIGAGGTIGALLGPALTRALVQTVGVANLMLVSALLLGLCLVCILKLRSHALRREREQGIVAAGQPIGGSVLAGFGLVWRDPLLRALSLLMFFGVGVGTLLYSEQVAIARAAFADPSERAAYFSTIDLAINVLTILVQVFLTGRLMTRFGIAPLLLLPGLAIMLGFALLAASPLPVLVALVQIVTRASEFSLAKPARETIYTRVDRESRYKAKAFIDTVVYRAGDLSFVWLHKPLAAMGSTAVFGVGVFVAAGFFLSAWRVVRAQQTLPEQPAPATRAASAA